MEVGEWKHSFTCSQCDSELEANASDVVHLHIVGNMMQESSDTYHVVCAVCSNKHNIPAHKLPKLIQLEAQKKSGKEYPYL